jgi:hypothetical protein
MLNKLREECMSLYQFVLKETPQGKADHVNHLGRRQEGTQKGPVIGVFRQGDVAENYVGGSWYYTWVVESSSINNVTAFIRECVHYGFVELYTGPTPVLTDGDSLEIENLSTQLRVAFPER